MPIHMLLEQFSCQQAVFPISGRRAARRGDQQGGRKELQQYPNSEWACQQELTIEKNKWIRSSSDCNVGARKQHTDHDFLLEEKFHRRPGCNKRTQDALSLFKLLGMRGLCKTSRNNQQRDKKHTQRENRIRTNDNSSGNKGLLCGSLFQE